MLYYIILYLLLDKSFLKISFLFNIYLSYPIKLDELFYIISYILGLYSINKIMMLTLYKQNMIQNFQITHLHYYYNLL